jgi:hypothetical protein
MIREILSLRLKDGSGQDDGTSRTVILFRWQSVNLTSL